MDYFNSSSKETKTHQDLCIDENASIALGLPFGQWLPVTLPPAPVVEGKFFTFGPVEVVDGQAVRTWVEVVPEEQPVAG